MVRARVNSSGRVGEVSVHDPQDERFHYKLQFGDGLAPSVDWFPASDVTMIGEAAPAEVHMADEESDLLCAICFEEVRQTVELPCSCNVTYCAQCWDRSLARSFNASGDATCPTCRTPVCVNFDADKLCLVFSPMVAAPVPDDPQLQWCARQSKMLERSDVIRRLREQAIPAQVKLLQNHGRRNPEVLSIAHDPASQLRRLSINALTNHLAAMGVCSDNESEDKDELVDSLLQQAKEKERLGHLLGDGLAEATGSLPSCVCGSTLIHVTGKERVMRHFDQYGTSRDNPEYQRVVNAMLARQDSCICLCDLCSKDLPLTDNVWTCQNTDTTILHPTSYDICDECFMTYVSGKEIRVAPVEPSV